jgi:hypothetical protein
LHERKTDASFINKLGVRIMIERTSKVPRALFDRFFWDQRRQEYAYLIPMARPTSPGVSVSQHKRFRVEFHPDGYAVLIPT